jgi:hypothetical protein
MVQVVSVHRSEKAALAALIRAAEVIAQNGKAGSFSVQIHQTGDEFNPFEIRLFERR